MSANVLCKLLFKTLPCLVCPHYYHYKRYALGLCGFLIVKPRFLSCAQCVDTTGINEERRHLYRLEPEMKTASRVSLCFST